MLVHEDSMHSLNDGDIVMFNEVQGMIEVNKKLFKVKVIGPKSFKISNTLTYGLYTGKGYATQVKMPL